MKCVKQILLFVLITINMMMEATYSSIMRDQGLLTILTLGHVAHGKSTLVRSITGTKTQKHRAELERNITINLGYANAKIWYNKKFDTICSLPSNDKTLDSNPEWQLIQHISFIDCPGHESLMSTMISGTHNFDIGFLLIAGNDKIMPQTQTYEHLLALAAIKKEITTGLILHNKLDLISHEEALANHAKVTEFLDGSPAKTLRILPISAQNGYNLQEVLRYIACVKPRHLDNVNDPAQLVIIRSFNVNKANGTLETLEGGVIGGSLRQGHFKIGDMVEIRPGILEKKPDGGWYATPLIAQIKKLYSETTQLKIAVPGGLLGIGLSLDAGLTKGNKLVGQVCSHIGHGVPIVDELKITYKKLNRGGVSGEATATNPEKGEKIKICIHAVAVLATITEILKKDWTIKLDSPIAFSENDNIVIMRNIKNRWQLAGTGLLISKKELELLKHIKMPSTFQESCAYQKKQTTTLVIKNDVNLPEERILDYHTLLNNIIHTNTNDQKSGGSKMEVPAPRVQPFNRITIWENFNSFKECLNKNQPTNADADVKHRVLIDNEKHFLTFLAEELAVSYSVNGEGQLLLNGRFKDGNIEKVIRNYLQEYRSCKNCNKMESFLYKDKMTMLYCNHCNSERSITN